MNQPQPPQQQGTQVSVEDVFPVYRKRVSDLHDETLILRAKVDILEKQLAAAQAENERLKQASPAPADPGQIATAAAAAAKEAPGPTAIKTPTRS